MFELKAADNVRKAWKEKLKGCAATTHMLSDQVSVYKTFKTRKMLTVNAFRFYFIEVVYFCILIFSGQLCLRFCQVTCDY